MAAEREHVNGRAKGGIITGVRMELSECRECKYRAGAVARYIMIGNEEWSVYTVYNRSGKKTYWSV